MYSIRGTLIPTYNLLVSVTIFSSSRVKAANIYTKANLKLNPIKCSLEKLLSPTALKGSYSCVSNT